MGDKYICTTPNATFAKNEHGNWVAAHDHEAKVERLSEMYRLADNRANDNWAEVERLRQHLREFGRHAEGCSAAFGEYRCRCGWDATRKEVLGDDS